MKKWIDKIKQKADNFDLFYQKTESQPVVFENNCYKGIDASFREGMGLRIIKEGLIGFGSASNLESFDELIDNAVETSKLGEKACFQFPEKNIDKKDLGCYSESLLQLTTEEMIDWAEFFIHELLKLNKKIKVNVTIEKELWEKKLFNSLGLNLEEKKTVLSFLITLFDAQENNFLELWDYGSFTFLPEKKDLQGYLDNLCCFYQYAQTNHSVKKGEQKVLFTPKAFSTLLDLLIQSFNGKLFEKKISYFYDKIGESFTDKQIDIIDDPLRKGMVYSSLFDGDGLPRRKIYLLQDGVVNSFPLDLQTAGKMKMKSNAHAIRSYSHLPGPGFSNIEFNIKKIKLVKWDDMVSQIDEGIIVDQFLGAGQSNVIGGEFSSNIEMGLVVKNGKIKGRVKDCMISGNIFDFFKNIVMMENKKYHYSRFHVPGILFDNICISSKR